MFTMMALKGSLSIMTTLLDLSSPFTQSDYSLTRGSPLDLNFTGSAILGSTFLSPEGAFV